MTRAKGGAGGPSVKATGGRGGLKPRFHSRTAAGDAYVSAICIKEGAPCGL